MLLQIKKLFYVLDSGITWILPYMQVGATCNGDVGLQMSNT